MAPMTINTIIYFAANNLCLNFSTYNFMYNIMQYIYFNSIRTQGNRWKMVKIQKE